MQEYRIQDKDKEQGQEDPKHQDKLNPNPSLLRLAKQNLPSPRFTVPDQLLVDEREMTPTHARSTQRCQTLVILTMKNNNQLFPFSLLSFLMAFSPKTQT